MKNSTKIEEKKYKESLLSIFMKEKKNQKSFQKKEKILCLLHVIS